MLKLTKEIIQKRSNLRHNNEYLIIGDYIGYDNNILTRHLKCGYEWNMNMNIGNHLNSNKGCPECAGNRKMTQSEFIKIK